ncbi:MAG: flavodoxin family protein [Promethearchaeota archaeon]
MKILILYISLTGRTKSFAESIAEMLESHDVRIEQFFYSKKGRDLIKEQEKIKNGDLSSISYKKDIEDLGAYDLVFFGTPVHGGQPAVIFFGYMQLVKNIKEKNFVLFATGRFTKGKTFKVMQSNIEKKGGSVVGEKLIKSLFKIKRLKIKKYTKELIQELNNLNIIQ